MKTSLKDYYAMTKENQKATEGEVIGYAKQFQSEGDSITLTINKVHKVTKCTQQLVDWIVRLSPEVMESFKKSTSQHREFNKLYQTSEIIQ